MSSQDVDHAKKPLGAHAFPTYISSTGLVHNSPSPMSSVWQGCVPVVFDPNSLTNEAKLDTKPRNLFFFIGA